MRADRRRRSRAAVTWIALLLLDACSDSKGDPADAATGAGRSGADASADAAAPDAGASGRTAGAGGSATGTRDGGLDAGAGRGGSNAGTGGGGTGADAGAAGASGNSADAGESGDGGGGTGGAGGIGGRGAIGTDCGCTLYRQGGRCAEERPILWECFGPGPLPMLAAECIDLATAFPRYCCAEAFDPDCE